MNILETIAGYLPTISAPVHRALTIIIAILTAGATFVAVNYSLVGISPALAAGIGNGVNIAVTLLRILSDPSPTTTP